MNESISNKHVACVTEFDHVSMNQNPCWGTSGNAFGACVKEEGEGVVIGFKKTTSH